MSETTESLPEVTEIVKETTSSGRTLAERDSGEPETSEATRNKMPN